MNDESLDIDPRIGDAVYQTIFQMTGVECHIVLIACPIEEVIGEVCKLGQPSFITSLESKDMENLLVQIAGNFAVIGAPTVKRGTN